MIFQSQGDRNLYGNNVTLRNSALPSGAMRSWIDSENPLPSGIISRYFIYVHDIPTASLDNQSCRIRLQIWRPDDPTISLFKLVWQQLVVIDAYPNTGALYTVVTVVVVQFMFL